MKANKLKLRKQKIATQRPFFSEIDIEYMSNVTENVSSRILHQVRFKQACSATEAS